MDIEMPIPSIDEQKQIGEYFANLDNLITLHQRKFEKLTNVKKSMLEKMFPQNGSSYPEIRFKGFTDPWEQRKVRDVANRYDNLRVPVAANLRVSGTTPYYGANGIQDYVEGYTHEGEYVLVAEDGANDLKNYPVKCVNGRIWVNNHAHVLQGKAKIADNQFLAYSINQADIESLLVGGSRAKLNAETLMDIELTLPSLPEQQEIGTYLKHLDNLITLHQRKCANLCSPSQVVFSLLFATSTFSWEQRKFDEVFDCTVPNNTLSRAELSYDEGTVLNVHYGDVLIKYGSVLDVQKDDIPRIPHRCREDFNGALLQDGDVIIADTAEDETTGKACEIGNLQGSAIVSGLHTMVCRPRNRMALGYLGYYLNSNAYHHQLLPLMQGIKVLSLSRSNIQKTSVSYPIAVKEQQLIAYYFSQLDNLITLHQRECISFTGRADRLILTANKKRTTSSWEQRKFEEIAVRSSVICSDDTLPRVEYEDIVSGTGRLNKDIYAKQSSKSGIAFHQGDVLYGKLRPYLQNWLLPTFDGLAVGDFWVLQPQNADSSFLYRLIQSRQFDEVANQSTGTKMPRADWKLVSKTVFSIPSSISEQAAIGTYFTALDSLITLHQRELEKLQNIKKSMLEKMFV